MRLSMLGLILKILMILSISNIVLGTTTKKMKEPSGLNMEYFTFTDRIYSEGKKTEIGDQSELDLAFKYHFTKNTNLRFRFETRPEDNRFNNETSKFEFILFHSFKGESEYEYSLDFEWQTDKASSGGMAVGFDLDSEGTFIRWKPSEYSYLTFYPFNFDGEVGEHFNIWDVTRIYFINGTPTTINGIQGSDDRVIAKTIPGVQWNLNFSKGNGFYIGLGAASYEYPANPDFDLQNNASSLQWERREDIGYKFGLHMTWDRAKFEAQYVAHKETEETGALLESATSFYYLTQWGSFIYSFEGVYTKAGQSPWNLSNKTQWFSETTTFLPVYSDYNGKTQDWVGKGDFATQLKMGKEFSNWTPYLSLAFQGKNFIFNEKESAHRLRTNFELESHGGLTRVGLGSYFYRNQFTINPEIEFRQAKNDVFTNASDLRSNNDLSQFKNTDILLTISVSYNFDGQRVFKP